MSITIVFDPAAPVHVQSATRVSVAGVTNDAVNYTLIATCAGQPTLTSQVFATGSGKFVWDNLIFPGSGTWSVRLDKVSDHSDAKTQTVSVS